MQIKDIFKLTDKMVLFEIENKIFCITNELFNKQKKIKKYMYKLSNHLMHQKQMHCNF